MKLKIDKDITALSLQKQFNTFYPYLKIEFLMTLPKKQIVLKAEILSKVMPLKQSDNFYDGKTIDINKEQTVSDVEREFKSLFGLSVAIFRRSYNVWVEIVLTKGMTLGQQNGEGDETSHRYKK